MFKVQRKKDGKFFALKFVVLKNDKIRRIMRSEIGLMQICNDNDGILRVIECYDYKERLWVIVELMDDACTNYIQQNYKTYRESIVRYLLAKTLVGLHYLH